jgi:hypothetical protein
MSEQIPPRPRPGTKSVFHGGDDELPRLPGHRDSPDQVASDEARGRTRHIEQAQEARADAVAADLARATHAGTCGPGPLHVPVTAEVAAMSNGNLVEDVTPHLDERARAVAEAATAQVVSDVAGEAEREAERDRVALRGREPAESSLGTRLTHPVVPFVVLVLFSYIELKLTAPSLRAALASATAPAEYLAAVIAVVPILAAELVGLAAGAAVRGSKRPAQIVLLTLAVMAAACTVWSVVSLSNSRTTNIAYKNGLQPAPDPYTSLGAGFGPPTAIGAAANTATGPTASASPAASKAPTKPDLGFVVPLTFVGLLAAAGLAMRCTDAHPHRRWLRQMRSADNRCREATQTRVRAEQEAIAHARPLDASDLRIGALHEREQEIQARLRARIRAEYDRCCHALGVRPLALNFPDPNGGDDVPPLVMRLVDPQRAFSTQPIVITNQAGDPPGAPGPEAQPNPAPDDELQPDDGPTAPGAEPSEDQEPVAVTWPPEDAQGPREQAATGGPEPAATEPADSADTEPVNAYRPTDPRRPWTGGHPAGWVLFDQPTEAHQNGRTPTEVIERLHPPSDEDPT